MKTFSGPVNTFRAFSLIIFWRRSQILFAGSDRERAIPLFSPLEAVLNMLERRFSLLHERSHAFFLVFSRKQRMKHAPLEQHALGKR
jgi:hypothetical protein